jgi:hypothetical protein
MKMKAAADCDVPRHTVLTGGVMISIVSVIENIEYTSPPVLFTITDISSSGSEA